MKSLTNAARPRITSIVAGFVAAAVAVGVLVATPSAHAELSRPVIELPDPSATFCDRPGTDFDLSGTANTGTPLEVVSNQGVLGSPVDPAEDGTFTIPMDRPVGDHFFKVQQHEGETLVESDPVSVTVFGLDHVLGSVAPSPLTISPKNADGQYDSTTITVGVLKPGRVGFLVYKGDTLAAYSPVATKSAPGTFTWTWNGKGSSAYNAGAVVGSGTYQVRSVWASDATCSFTRVGSVNVDTVTPSLVSFGETPDTFYPREDDDLTEYKDAITFSWTGLTEESYTRVEIYKKGATKPITTLSYGWDTGNGSINWNGRKSDGSVHAPGTYQWNVLLTDRVKNVKRTTKRSFVLSGKRLDERTVSVARNGNDYALGSASGCGGGDESVSDWVTGVWMAAVDCSIDSDVPDASRADYRFQMPSAPYYHSVELKVYGYSMNADPIVGFLHNQKTGDDDVTGANTASAPALRSLGKKSASSYIDSQRKVHASLFLFSLCDCADVEYDVRTVYARLSYGVLVA